MIDYEEIVAVVRDTLAFPPAGDINESLAFLNRYLDIVAEEELKPLTTIHCYECGKSIEELDIALVDTQLNSGEVRSLPYHASSCLEDQY